MISMKVSLPLFFGMMFLVSCQTYNYAPLPVVNPMFTEKGQMEVLASANIRHFQGQFSYSPVQKASFTYGFSRVHKAVGMGSSHGLQLQYYNTFRKEGAWYYQLGIGVELGGLENAREQEFHTNRGSIPYIATAKSKYYAPVFGAGIYWCPHDEQTQFGFDISLTSARYTQIDYTRVVESDSGSYLWHSVHNDGAVIPVPIFAAALSLKHTGSKGLFFYKYHLGYRLNESSLYLPNRVPNGRYEKEFADFDIPDLIFSFSVGMNLHALKR